MLKHFTGTHDHKVDDKGRVSLPTEFRRVLDTVKSSGALYIVPQLDDPRAHVVFTIEAYSALIERHNAREYPTYEIQQLMELRLVTRASQVQVDDVGRIVIARPLREMIALQKQVRFVGATSTFEIWEPGARDLYEAELAAKAAEVPDAAQFLRIDRRGLH